MVIKKDVYKLIANVEIKYSFITLNTKDSHMGFFKTINEAIRIE